MYNVLILNFLLILELIFKNNGLYVCTNVNLIIKLNLFLNFI